MNDQAPRISAFGFATQNEQGIFEGKFTISGYEYKVLSEAEVVQSNKGNVYNKVQFLTTNGAPPLYGKLFRTQNMDVVDKLGFSIYATLVEGEGEAQVKTDHKISGVFRDKNRKTGEMYKKPLYILSIMPPSNMAAPQQAPAEMADSDVPF